jgi:hypothetical protein
MSMQISLLTRIGFGRSSITECSGYSLNRGRTLGRRFALAFPEEQIDLSSKVHDDPDRLGYDLWFIELKVVPALTCDNQLAIM